VINVSFTGIQNPVVETAGKYARSKGALLVYSAGNQGMERADWPDYPHVLAVGATSIDDTLWSWYRNIFKKGGSNFGHFIDIVAPGHNVTSTTTYISHNPGGDKYRKGSGTSYSAPIVSGVAALIFSVNPKLGPEQVEQILLESAQPLGDEYYYGAGQVNAHRAVQMAWETI
jgi:subtilisin family serine protease